MVHPKIDVNDLYSYIKHQFINVDDTDDWYTKFKRYLGEMGGWNDEKLNLMDIRNCNIFESEEENEDDNDEDDDSDIEDYYIPSPKVNKRSKRRVKNRVRARRRDRDRGRLRGRGRNRKTRRSRSRSPSDLPQEQKSKANKQKNAKKALLNIEQGSVFLFQLNSCHPWFKSTNTFNRTKDNDWFNDIKMFVKYHKNLKKIKRKSVLGIRRKNQNWAKDFHFKLFYLQNVQYYT